MEDQTGELGSFRCGIFWPRDLWGHVDGSETLAVDATDVLQTDFRLKAQRAFSTIVMAVGTSQLYLVTSCTNAKEAWDLLCEHFEGKTLANKLYLKKRYFRCEMKEDTSVEQHLKQMKEITDKLAAIGAPIRGGSSCNFAGKFTL